MSEKLLFLSPAKPVEKKYSVKDYARIALGAVGLLFVLIGAADLSSRAAAYSFGSDANTVVFAPAILSEFNLTNATTTPIVPSHLKIPAIGVDASVEQVGKKDDGSMATPKNFNDVGWYSLGSEPGQSGNAVFAGHVNNALTEAGVFEHLADLKVGDYITVEDTSGKALVYVVRETDEYPADTAPAASIFTTAGPSQVVLITCDGDWVPDAHSFNQRLVVIASLVH